MRNKSSALQMRQLLQSQQQLVMQIQAQTQAVNRLAQSIEQLAEVIALDYAEQELPTNVGLDGRTLG
ncbi:hypothetical protein O987_07090 [Comamonas testosteroni TK102]|uniref:Uncharacterized protein n=1 Tax=Comamonas testosteroni TK102 TaxID=1392005 RepID=A0A076PQF0_COMTE|nr:hypothetical protein [Comamonas testosteroni]AIJ45562.1 hypothetical protein O987_07090 [Comamonas testosteroni TK102]